MRGDDTGDGLGDGGMGGRQVGRGQRQQAARREDLLADEHVLGEQPRERVADRDLADPSAAVAVALEVRDRREIDRGLDREPLAGCEIGRPVPRPRRRW